MRPVFHNLTVIAVLVASIGVGAACARADAAGSREILRPGDTVAVNVFAHPELTTAATVDGAGNIYLQSAGTIAASGANAATVADRVAARLSRIIYDPVVDIRITDRGKSVFISGGTGAIVGGGPAGSGGTIPYTPGMTLTSLVAQLVLLPSVDVHMISIERNGEHLGPYDLYGLQNRPQSVPALLAGDVVTLPNKTIGVVVEGAVKTPGKTFVDPGQSVADAIAQAGGPADGSNSSAIEVKRDGTTTVGSLGSAFVSGPAQDGDTVRLPPAVRVTVAGQVEKSGEVSLGSDQRLMEALYLAGGPNRWSDLRDVQIIHDGQARTIDVTKMPYGDKTGANPWLHDGDVVFVPEGHKVDFRGFFQNVLLGAGIARSVNVVP